MYWRLIAQPNGRVCSCARSRNSGIKFPPFVPHARRVSAKVRSVKVNTFNLDTLLLQGVYRRKAELVSPDTSCSFLLLLLFPVICNSKSSAVLGHLDFLPRHPSFRLQLSDPTFRHIHNNSQPAIVIASFPSIHIVSRFNILCRVHPRIAVNRVPHPPGWHPPTPKAHKYGTPTPSRAGSQRPSHLSPSHLTNRHQHRSSSSSLSTGILQRRMRDQANRSNSHTPC